MAYDVNADYKVGALGARDGVPGRDAWVITSSASDQAKYPRMLFVNTAGTVSGIPIDGADDTVLNFTAPAGEFRMGFRRITACPANTIGIR
jgi:hypothetical protein